MKLGAEIPFASLYEPDSDVLHELSLGMDPTLHEHLHVFGLIGTGMTSHFGIDEFNRREEERRARAKRNRDARRLARATPEAVAPPRARRI